MKLAATGKVRCRFTLRGLSELNQYVFLPFIESWIASKLYVARDRVYDEMEKGEIVGRVVLDIDS